MQARARLSRCVPVMRGNLARSEAGGQESMSCWAEGVPGREARGVWSRLVKAE